MQLGPGASVLKKYFFFSFAVISFFALLNLQKGFSYQAVICAVFRDEERYLKEWIDYHEELGFEHFYLYNDYSKYEFIHVLAPYIEKGTVTLLHRSEVFPGDQGWFSIFQVNSYNHFLKHFGQETEWCAYIDIDEFIVPHTHTSIIDFLQEFDEEPIGSIYAFWQCFGTSYIPSVPEGRILENLTLKAPENDPLHKIGKSIVKTKHQVGANSCHFAFLNPGYHQVTAPISHIQINHYFCRDQDFFYNIRCQLRKNLAVFNNNTLNSDVEDRFNVIHDISIHRVIKK